MFSFLSNYYCNLENKYLWDVNKHIINLGNYDKKSIFWFCKHLDDNHILSIHDTYYSLSISSILHIYNILYDFVLIFSTFYIHMLGIVCGRFLLEIFYNLGCYEHKRNYVFHDCLDKDNRQFCIDTSKNSHQ